MDEHSFSHHLFNLLTVVDGVPVKILYGPFDAMNRKEMNLLVQSTKINLFIFLLGQLGSVHPLPLDFFEWW